MLRRWMEVIAQGRPKKTWMEVIRQDIEAKGQILGTHGDFKNPLLKKILHFEFGILSKRSNQTTILISLDHS